jgi:hypothetical protein
MVMTSMVIIIPQLQPPLAARGSPTIDQVSPGDHAADAQRGVLALGRELWRRAGYSVFYGQ